MERVISDAKLHDLTLIQVKLEAGDVLPSDLSAVASLLLSDGSTDTSPTVDGSAVVDQIVFCLKV